MIFNSYSFLFAFLPLTLIIYYLCGKVFRKDFSNIILSVASLIFVACSGLYHAAMLCLSVAVNYVMNLFLSNSKEQQQRKKITAFIVVLNIGFLCSFKYIFPLLKNEILGELQNCIMPLGISFYTFGQIAYVLENYKYNFHKKYGVVDYVLSFAFFAKFLQGPITYHNELIPQFQNRDKYRFSYENFSQGLYALGIGLIKKVLVADNFAKIVDYGYGHISTLSSFEAVLSVIAYSLQLYFDFSGYCDMAIGIAKMFNINLSVNFNSPYKAKNISEFWKCWHMTLTRFLTKYVYIPLGGNRKGAFLTYVNIMIIFLVSGLWHGTGVTFVVWGIMHGVASVLYRMFKGRFDKLPDLVQWLLTFVYVNMAWVVFRAPSIGDASALLKRIFVGGGTLNINAELTETLLQSTIISASSRLIPFNLIIILFVFVAVLICVFAKNSNECIKDFTPKWSNLILLYILLCLSVTSISGVSTFLYVNF